MLFVANSKNENLENIVESFERIMKYLVDVGKVKSDYQLCLEVSELIENEKSFIKNARKC